MTLGEDIMKRIGGQIRHQRLQKKEYRVGGASRILLLTQQPLVLCKFNQFPCSLEANNEANVGRGHGDVGGDILKRTGGRKRHQRLQKTGLRVGGP